MQSIPAGLWRNRPFRALLLAHFASNLGDWLAFIALFNLAALQWHANAVGIGLLTASYLLPFGLIAPLAGVFVDRWELRRLMVLSDVLRCGIVCLMLLATRLSDLCVLIFLHQSVSTFFNPAQQAAVPRLVRQDELLAANALTTQASHATKVLGPGVAGLLVAALGTRGCLLLDAVTFLVSGALLTALPLLRRRHDPGALATSVSADLRSALGWMRRNRRLQGILVSLTFCIAGLGSFLVALPLQARDTLSLGPRGMGFLLSALGSGTLFGAWGVVSLSGRDRVHLLIAAEVLLCFGLLGLALLGNAFAAAAVLVLLGVATAMLVVPAHTILQEETPEALRGRVISVALSLLAGSQVTGMGVAAWLVAKHSAALALGGAALLAAAAACVLLGARLQHRGATGVPADPLAVSGSGGIHAGDRG